MTKERKTPEDFVITFRPEATPQEKERLLTEFAHAVLAVARHVVSLEEAEPDETLESIEW